MMNDTSFMMNNPWMHETHDELSFVPQIHNLNRFATYPAPICIHKLYICICRNLPKSSPFSYLEVLVLKPGVLCVQTKCNKVNTNRYYLWSVTNIKNAKTTTLYWNFFKLLRYLGIKVRMIKQNVNRIEYNYDHLEEEGNTQ